MTPSNFYTCSDQYADAIAVAKTAASGIAAMCVMILVMLPMLPQRGTNRDGLHLVILWLSVAVGWVSRALFALAEGYARFRQGVDAAAAAGRVETVAAWRDAEVSR
jgi:hypothetical protein